MPSDLPEDMQATLSSEEGRVAELFLNSLKEFGEVYTDYIHTQLIACPIEKVENYRAMYQVYEALVQYLQSKIQDGRDANMMLRPMTEEELGHLANDRDFYSRLGDTDDG